MNTRRQFISALPLAGLALLTACADKSAPTTTSASAPPADPPAPATPTPSATAPAASSEPAVAAAPPAPVPETDPVAMSLGYDTDASRVDGAKYKAYVAGQNCASCSLYQGKPGEPLGPCPLFNGRLVNANGWCSAHAQKPAAHAA